MLVGITLICQHNFRIAVIIPNGTMDIPGPGWPRIRNIRSARARSVSERLFRPGQISYLVRAQESAPADESDRVR